MAIVKYIVTTAVHVQLKRGMIRVGISRSQRSVAATIVSSSSGIMVEGSVGEIVYSVVQLR